MMDLWQLPVQVNFQGTPYHLHTDYRDILEIFSYLEDPDLPETVRWRIAMALFYEEPVRPEHYQAALIYLNDFLCCGQEEKPGPRLMDWEQDAQAILAGVNRVAGQEIRDLPFLHWWTFLSFFHAIGEGQLSTLVAIREKLARGKKLETWEKEFYSRNREQVELRKKYSASELAEQERLKHLLECQ